MVNIESDREEDLVRTSVSQSLSFAALGMQQRAQPLRGARLPLLREQRMLGQRSGYGVDER
jgi:hypothetical protein